MGALRGAWCGLLFILLMAMINRSSGQQCTPANNSHGMIIPNTDLPNQGVRLYFQEAAQPIPDFLMLRASQIEPDGFNNMSATRALWCQSANNNSNNGTWFQPPGSTVVSSEDIDGPPDVPYQMVTCPGQVGLVRDFGLADTDNIGLVQCMIRDEMNTTHTLTAGVYTGRIYDNYVSPIVDANMQYTLISSRDADLPVFTLSFNSSNGPPTVVNCTRDSQALDTSLYTVSRVVLQTQYVQNGDVDSLNASEPDMPDMTRVTVTVREREAGEYRCNVTVMGRDNDIPTQVVTLGTSASTLMIMIAGTPTNVAASRSSATNVNVTWGAPSPTPDGYEVFYQIDGGDIFSGGTTTNTELVFTVALSSVLQELSCFVVAFSDNAIPSARSDVAIFRDFSITSFSSNNNNLAGSDDFTITCVAGVTMNGTDSLNVTIRDSFNMILASDIFSAPMAGQYSVNYTFSQLSPSDAGTYTCVLTATVGNMSQAVNNSLDVTVHAPTVTVALDNLGSPLLAGTSRSLMCSFDPMGLIVAVSWTKDGTPLSTGGRVTISTVEQSNSTLTLNPLRTSDGAKYECVLTVTIMNGRPPMYTFPAMIDLNVTIPIANSNITVTTNPSGTQHPGTPVNIVCTVADNDNVDTSITIVRSWLGPMVLNNSADYNITGDTLRINELSTSDNERIITCMATILPGTPYVLQSSTASGNTQLSAYSASVSLNDMGSPAVAGTERSLMCVVNLSPGNFNCSWLRNGTAVVPDDRVMLNTSPGSATLTFSLLRTSDGGQYTCVCVDTNGMVSENIDLSVAISISSVTVTTIPNDTLYVDTFSDFQCNATLSEYVDTPTTIMYQWLGPSLLTTGADYNITGDTLRIKRFNASRDNDRNITCMATVIGQQYVLQNTASESVQLTVVAIDGAAFTPHVIIPGVPTAGDNFNIICRLDGAIERLTERPSFVILDYSVTQGGVSGDSSQNGSVYFRLRRFNTGTTDNVGDYRCRAIVNVFGMTFSSLEVLGVLQIRIPPPQLTLTITPSNPTTLYEGTPVNLTCTIDTTNVNTAVTVSSMWIAPNGEQLTSGSSDRITIVDMLQSAPYTSVLMFDPADDMDTGDYQCNVTVAQNSGQPLILPSSNNATTNLNVTALPDPIIDVTTVGSTEAGQSFSLVCNVTMPTEETPRPNVTWIKVTGGSTTFPTATEQTTPTTTTLNISFSPLTFSHRGQYRCMVTLNISTIYTFAGNESYDILVDFPPPTVVVQPVNPSVPMVAGTARNLTCTINLTNVDDINVMVNFTWGAPMRLLLPSSPRIDTISGTTQSANQSSFISTLSISPLDSEVDTTTFACLVNVDSDPADSFIIPTTANDTVNITVQPLPPPTVMTTSSGDMSPGSTITLTCTVGVVDGLIVQPDIVWTKQAVGAGGDAALNSISVGAMRTDNIVTLSFNPTNTSDAGQYTCTATVDITAINITVTNNSMVNIRLQIPSPTVSLTLSSASGNVSANSSTSQSYLAGSTLTITCVIVIPLTVNTPFEVDMEWSMDGDDDFDTSNVGSGSTAGSRIDITTATKTMPNRYQTQLVFSTLSSSMDSGSYECSISIDSNDTLLYVDDSTLVNESTTVSVSDPTISNFTVAPTMVAVLESTCLDSDPHDSFTLVCRAMKPSVVIPQLMVQWLHNGSMRAGDLSVSDNGAYVVNTLNVSNAQVNDTGLYQCVATIMIPDSPTVTTNASSMVDSRAMSVPNTPNVSITTINPTDATITITVPNIAYTRETYYILYSGQERDTDLAQSDNVTGTADILATNSNYVITLSGLEEDTTYNYTVTASNCIGNTTTATMSFRTLSTVPAAPPMNCISSTFFSTNATLQWMPPPPIDQNGAITGYSLTCPNVTTNLDFTLNSSLTTFIISSGVVPFRNYSCVLAAINVNGTSPNTTTCSFETAQDTPGDPPNNFTVMVSMRSLWYRWTPPTLPNGIITGYTLVAVETQPLGAPIRSYLLCGLTPGQAVTATIRASTIIGQGPLQTLMRTTTALANTGVANLRATGPSATMLDITWAAPTTPHGFVNRYTITVVNMDAKTGTADATTPVPKDTRSITVPGFTTSFSGMAGVPYYVTVTPWDHCNITGDAMNITVFTQQLPALGAPVYTTDRSPDGTVMVVRWTLLTLEETRGFITYRVVLTPALNNKRQSGMIAQTVSMDQSSVTFNMLDPALPYSVAVGVVNNNITDGVVNPHPSNIITATAVPPGPPIGIIAGVIVVVILAIIAAVVVAIIIVVLWKRHQERTGIAKFKDSMFQVEATPTVRPLVTSDVSLEATNGDTVALTEVGNKNAEAEDEGETETRMDEEMVLEHMKPIAKASFNEHVQQMHVNSDAGFEKEYQSVLMQISGITFATSGLDCNKSKNRFANIFPYDHNRVQMAVQDGADGTDYVNASFVDGYAHVGAYIAAQGPLPTTIGDFWRMIWEYKATDVVMLTGVVEAGKKKCEQYWPDKVGETLDPHNGLMVTMISHVPFSDFIIRNLKLAKPGDESAKTLDITHYHFTAWPDHGVPQFATSLISFIGRIQKKHKKDAKIPLLVHCSAGVGRTGTFIMLDTMMDRLKNEDSINVYEFLHQMRKQRMHMVQTQPQYVFIHDALDELITCGETDIAASNLRARVNKMHKIVPGKNMSGFQDQFQLLEQVCYKPGEAAFTDSTQPYNLPKNRYPDKLPFNVSRPRLRPDGTSGSDYINGNFVDGYKQRNAYIVTQGPLKGTVNDLWRMMWEFKSRAIVMLCNTVEEGEEKCYQYWPLQKDEYIEFGKLKVTLQSEDVHEQYVVRKLHVCNEKGSKQDKDGVVVTQLHYTAWPEHGHPSATVHIIEMMELLTRVQMKSGNKPITVLCNDGIGRSGAFLCIHSQLERLKTDGEVDAFKYLKTARTRRQGLIAELDHYVFCHEVLADYVESFDPYANFKDV